MDNAAKAPGQDSPSSADFLKSKEGADAVSTLVDVLARLPVGLALIGAEEPSLPVQYLNSRACLVAGAQPSEVLGRPLANAIPAPPELVEAVREAHRRGSRRLRYRSLSGQTWDFEAIRLDGPGENGARVLATWREVAEPAAGAEKAGPEEAGAPASGAGPRTAGEGAGDRLHSVDAGIELGGRQEDPERLLEPILRWTADEAKADLALLLRREGDDLVPAAAFDRDGSGLGPPQRISLTADPESRRALELGRSLLSSPPTPAVNSEVDARLRELRHTARVPLAAEEPPGLLLLLGRRGGDAFSEGEGESLELLARQATPAIRNALLYDGAQRTARRLQLGVDVALDVATRLEPEEVVQRILRRALEAADAERAMLARSEGGLQCTIVGSVALAEEPPPVRLSISLEGQDPAMRAIQTLRPAQGRLAYEEIEMRPLRWSVVVPLVARGELIALLTVARDRRQFDENEVAVLQQIGAMAALAFRNATLFQSLRETSQVRGQFLSMAAHELRTPLSVIGGYVSMLADGTLGAVPAAWQSPLSVLEDKTRELAHLIDDILLAGRLDGGMVKTSGRAMSLSASLQDALRRARPRASLLGAELVLEAPEGEARVWAHPDHVARILDNLLNNALNYSAAPPRVRLALEQEGGAAVVRVEDTGQGIAPEHRERIFQQFYRVEDPAQGHQPGTGLGLFISRGLAERYGGSLDLEWSEPGAGSRFALRLPLAA